MPKSSVELRPATMRDWDIIRAQQEAHLVGTGISIPNGLDISYPDYFDAFWILGSVRGKPVASIGWMDTDDNRQIVLLWNRGIKQARAAVELMEFTCDVADQEEKNLWFLILKDMPESIRRGYEKFGFKEVSHENPYLTTYWRDW